MNEHIALNEGIRDAGRTADFKILFEIFEILEIFKFLDALASLALVITVTDPQFFKIADYEIFRL